MEEDWDIVNDSLNSSASSSHNNNKSKLVETQSWQQQEEEQDTTSKSSYNFFPELDFNRFANQPEFEIEDDLELDDDEYEQQLRDEGVIFCESPPPDMMYEDEYENEYEYEYQEQQPPEEEVQAVEEQEEIIDNKEQQHVENQENFENEIEQEAKSENQDQSIEKEEEEINFTLGDSDKLMNNDTNSNRLFDDVARNIMLEEEEEEQEKNNNELEQQRINQYKNNHLSSFFPFDYNQPFFFMDTNINNLENMINNDQEGTSTTRESELDKTAIWKNSTSGSSVPFVSDDSPPSPPTLPQEENENVPMFFGFGAKQPLPQVADDKRDKTYLNFSNLQASLERSSSTSSLNSREGSPHSINKSPIPSSSLPLMLGSEIRGGSPNKSSRPIAQLKRSNQRSHQPVMTQHTLPSFAASPKVPRLPPILTIQHLTHYNVDVPPVEEPLVPEPVTVDTAIQTERIEGVDEVVQIDMVEESPPVQTMTAQVQTEPIQEEKQEKNEERNEEVFQDPDAIKQNFSHCFQFSTATNEAQHHQYMAKIFLKMSEKIPDIPQWFQLKSLNLNRQNITSLNNLKNCLPRLEILQIAHNELKSIYGLPDSLCYLDASHNKLLELDIYQLYRLQFLDISNNFIQTLGDMSLLVSLRGLDASYNNINSCKPFQALTGVIQLSLKSNSIRKLSGFLPTSLNTHQQQQQQLESLDLSFNRIECLDSIATSLKHLRELNLDHNDIKCIQLDQPMERLCKLKLSFNRLESFDVSPFPDIRILYLDDNRIQRIIGVACISRLDSFSMRDQGRNKVEYNLQYLRGTRKLYLSGSPFKNMHQMVDFYSLDYLELCSAGLEELPSNFGKQVPNLQTLYLSMNRLQDIRPLKKLKYLRTLILIDNKLISLNEVLAVVKHLRNLRHLDLRQNPMCANIYPQMRLTQTLNEAERISHYVTTAMDDTWEATDNEYLQTLPDHWRTRREVYRALLIKECPKLVELDHLVVDAEDRSSGDLVIENYYKARSTPNPA